MPDEDRPGWQRSLRACEWRLPPTCRPQQIVCAHDPPTLLQDTIDFDAPAGTGDRPKAHIREQVRSQRHQAHEPHQRISTVPTMAAAGQPEMLAVLVRVGDTQRRPVQAEEL